MLGFKPLAALEQHHQLREPTFIYPDERHFPGSTAAFIALHGEVCLTRTFMLDRAVMRDISSPSHCTLRFQGSAVDALQLVPVHWHCGRSGGNALRAAANQTC